MMNDTLEHRTTPAAKRIHAVRDALGKDLAILAHHYQSDDVIAHADVTGDSLELARQISDMPAKHIVFCGVHFMAETAAALAAPGQQVHLPDATAGCVMANMVPGGLLETVLQKLEAGGRKILPLAYVNTSAAVKAVVGARGGAVCTSANASRMLSWALQQAGPDGAVAFLPDHNLGNNAANTLKIEPNARHMLNVRQNGLELDLDAAAKAQLLLWPGSCVIHYRFTVRQIEDIRAKDPAARIIVHPECSPEVVDAADASGSTSTIIKYVEGAPPAARIYIGTEINLVARLTRKYAGSKTILPLATSACSNMAKTTEENLAALLEHLRDGTAGDVTVDPALVEPVRASILRMLEVGRREADLT